MKKKSNPYFEDFIKMADYSLEAAEYLQTTFLNFDPKELAVNRAKMHKIENSADMVKHTMIRRLAKEFVSPINREDIIELVNELDDLTDKIDDMLMRMYMYDIKELRPAASKFADVIVKCCKTLRVAMQEFSNYKKPDMLVCAIIDVNSMEEEGDALYINAVHELYQSETDPVKIAVWSELFDRFEDCCDSCEHVANTLEVIVMKNS